ncbi:hypothetical protein PR202_gb10516 [Eleusine coracana subsp. coracana]|uniref:Uncharacterized protein n=1 Tax=Eleusine coracana subsp. coracana TaxID=191504 RepID=A0AAV5EJH8_ELECO|nr:hypothetical protein PR202_gb10516 [Eleusine coracana subsp. coracana]
MSICGYHSPRFSEDCMFIRGPSQEHQNCQNAVVNGGGYSGFILHLSGDEETVACTPISSNVQPFTLHLSSESDPELSPVEGNGNPQILNSGSCKGPLKGSCADDQEQEVDVVCQNQFGSKDPHNDLPDIFKAVSKEINKPLDANKHNNVSGRMIDVQKLRNADVNGAIELSVAASEAMVIAEIMLHDIEPDSWLKLPLKLLYM